MKSIPMEKTYLLLNLMFSFLVSDVLGEMFVKESKVDPFSLILSNQKQLMDTMNTIAKKLESVNTIESKLYTLTSFVVSMSNKMEKMQSNFNSMGDILNDISQEVYAIKNIHMSNLSAVVNKKSSANDCEELVNVVLSKIPNQIVNESTLFNKINNEKVDKLPGKVHEGEMLPIDGDPNYQKEATNETPTLGENLSRSFGDSEIVSAVNDVINARLNTTRDQLIRVLSLLHNIEYRQHVSTITQDRRLHAVIHKMAVHQGLLEERMSEKITEEFKVIREELQVKIGAIEGRFSYQDGLISFLLEVTTNLSSDLGNNPLSKNHNFSIHVFNSSRERELIPNLEVMEYSTIDEIEDPTNNFYSSNEVATPGNMNVSEFEDIQPEINLTSKKSDMLGSNSIIGNLLGLHLPTISLNIQQNDSRKEYFKSNPSKQNLPSKVDQEVQIQQVSVAKHRTLEDDETITNLSSIIEEKIMNMGSALIKRMGATEDMITGLRIHQSSTIYSHTKEIRYEMDKLERGISETMQSIGNKIAKKLEGSRKALFAFIDAAVTSISSAAVSSAHSTSKHMATELQGAMDELAEKITKKNNFNYNSVRGCPEMYHRIGSRCYLDLTDVQTTWVTGCKICHALGGELAIDLKKNDLENLSNILESNISGLWLQTKRNSSETSNCDIVGEESTEELSNSLGGDGYIEKRNEINLCRTLQLRNLTVEFVSCLSRLGIICQYKVSNDYLKETFEGFNTNVSEIILV